MLKLSKVILWTPKISVEHIFFLEKLTVVDPIDATFNACDLNNDGLTIDEIHKSDCLETLQQYYGFENLTEIFLKVDENNDNIITKKEAEDAFTMMEHFARKCNLHVNGICEDE